MSIENQTRSTPELSRKQKIVRRFLPAVLLAGGAAAYGITENHSDESKAEHKALAEASATVSAHATVEFGESKTGWGHGAAERAIQSALAEGLSHVSVETTPGSNEPRDIEEIVETIPVYDQAEVVLEMAHYSKITPDPGDKLEVDLNVTLDSNGKVSYEITGAEIHDIANNQE